MAMSSKANWKSSATVDFSFSELTCLADMFDEEPREGVAKHLVDQESGQSPKEPRQTINTLKLNNNAISNIDELIPTLERVLWQPTTLTFLDISFNCLEAVSASLLDLPNLAILYLHGNSIANLKQVNKLGKLEKLHSVSFHGNVIEKEDGYRNYVTAMLPTIRKLDFSTITPSDRQRADTWRTVHAPRSLVKKKKTAP